MTHQADLTVRQNRCFMQFDELRIKCYKHEDVRQVSVLEVDQTNTFDEAGFPVHGGLYDARLGPSEEFAHCDTCGLSYAHCPGHYGHIALTVPVFNPLLFSFTFNLMKGTCIHCHRFTFDTNSLSTKIVIAKLRALAFGVGEILNGIEGAIKDRIANISLLAERIDVLGENTFLQELDQLIAELSGIKSIEELRSRRLAMLRHQNQLKNNLSAKNHVLKTFTKDYLLKRRTRCPRCKRANGEIRNDSGRALLLDFSKQNILSKKAKSIGVSKILSAHRTDEIFNMNEMVSKFKPHNDLNRPDLDFGGIEEEVDELKKFDVKSSQIKSTNVIEPNVLIDPLAFSNQLLAEQLEQIITGKCDKLAWRAAEVREHLRLVWQREGILLKQLFPFFDEEERNQQQHISTRSPIDILFMETIMVEPSRFRPIRFLNGERYEHPTTVNLRKLLEANQLLVLVKLYMQNKAGYGCNEQEQPQLGLAAKELIENRIYGKTMNEKLHNAYLDLQLRTNALFDQAANHLDRDRAQPGLKQILEKKEGLFRMHMMGKRVNYACRSVITPDPYLDIDEIGIPELFARRLTFPEPVSYLNYSSMKDFVRKGPAVYPGANFVEIAGTLGKPPFKVKLHDNGNTSGANERFFQASRLRTGDTNNVHSMPDMVLRHLKNGDRLLMNRQPSLHKPSIMGHKVRVLRGQNALRMNYAPCKAYNADFDGDEMNGHFVQNRVAQCEVAELANVGNNFLVPKDGTPILGLIQDHVVSGVLMTIRGQFFNKEDFMHLVLSAFAETTKRLKIPQPTIIKPAKLWSGKQVITAIIQNCCPTSCPSINLTGKAKTSIKCWQARDIKLNKKFPVPQFEMSESEVIFRQGELLSGVLDKAHYGATQFGLIHCCFELYGPQVAVQILSCFSRVFTTYLQFHGFTLGVADILVTKSADKERRRVIHQLQKCGEEVVQKTFALPEDAAQNQIKCALATTYNHPRDRSTIKMIDYQMKQALNKFAEQINGACVPSGLIRDFPTNSLQLMIQSGAKGSLVNSIQISCALGQIELEGHRPPLSVTGRSLPSFRSFDPSPRAGGFVEQRFLTGINPQELFFHTMAGREGLVDTAVKTSRSGYLQRCIIKHLEGLVVRYDHTVRDHDNSIIQFRYGEDGLDIGRSTFLNPKLYPFLLENIAAMRNVFVSRSGNDIKNADNEKWHLAETEKYYKTISKFKKRRRKQQTIDANKTDFNIAICNKGYRHSAFNEFHCKANTCYLLKDSIVADWKALSREERAMFKPKYGEPPIPVDMIFHPATSLGALPERILDQLNNFVRKKVTSAGKEQFKHAIYWKGLRALADPGECVGLLAAQSIGEPSTQMTLNTFHFAGRGEMNVTLGIPRLREILMTQSKNISTPMAEICIRSEVTNELVEKLKCELNPVMLRQLIQMFAFEEQIHVDVDGNCFREYQLTLQLLRNAKRDPMARHLKRSRIMRELETRFGREIAIVMSKRYKEVHEHQQIQHKKLRINNNIESGPVDGSATTNKKKQDDDLASDEEDAINGLRGEMDAQEERQNKRHLDDAAEYEGEEQDHGDVSMQMDELEDNLLEIGMEESVEDSEAEVDVDDDLDNENIRQQNNDGDGAGIKRGKRGEMNQDRVELVIKSNPLIVAYEYDAKSERWCRFKFRMPLRNKGTIDALALVEREIDKFVITHVRGLEKCIVREEERNGQTMRILQTQGINLEAFYARSSLLDVDTIYSNDINLMLHRYGVEAAMRTIVKEMNNVFGVYGIEVNPRHLTLTADYMTFTGDVQAFNRGAMQHGSSPLQKMTFETTIAFMQQAIINGHFDSLLSPSARLVLGQLIHAGTGAFDLLSDMNYALYMQSKKIRLPKMGIIEEISEMRKSRRRRKMKFYE